MPRLSPEQKVQVYAASEPFSGFAAPTSNTTFTPNQFFDVCVPNYSRGVVRLVGFLIRQALGWCDADGNPQHERIRLAEELGFRATLESQIGTGGADILLERDDLRIAVEISVTTGVSHELGNLLKCLTGDYAHVAFLTADLRKAEQIAERLRERVSEADASRVGFYQIETLVEYLQSLPKPIVDDAPQPTCAQPAKKKIKGWTVKTKVSDQTFDEARDNEEQALRAIAEALRKPGVHSAGAEAPK